MKNRVTTPPDPLRYIVTAPLRLPRRGMSQDGVSSTSFLRRLARAMAQSLLMKIVTFSLTTLLTRRVSHTVRGAMFAVDLYSDTVGFLSREAVRSCVLRNGLSDSEEAPDSRRNVGERPKGIEREAPETDTFGDLTRARLSAIFNGAALAVPFAAVLMASLETLAWASGGYSPLPALVFSPQLREASGASRATAQVGLLVVIGMLLQVAAEAKLCVLQAYGEFHVKLTAESAAICARVVTMLAFALTAPGATLLNEQPVLAVGIAYVAYGLAFFGVFEVHWRRRVAHRLTLATPVQPSHIAQRVVDVLDAVACRGLSLVSPAGMCAEAKRHAVFLRQFFSESVVRLFLTEGEKFALASMATLSDQGIYDTVMNLGSLVARLVFRLWEESCFAKWSATMSRATSTVTSVPGEDGQRQLQCFTECVALLGTMLAIAVQVALPFAVFGPPLAQPLLSRLYAAQWSDETTTAVLVQLCYTLPLMAVNGLLEAFVRATSTPLGLTRSKWCMMATSLLYVAMCYYALHNAQPSRSADTFGTQRHSPLEDLMRCLTASVAARIVLNAWLIGKSRSDYTCAAAACVEKERHQVLLVNVKAWWIMTSELLRASVRWSYVGVVVGLSAWLSQSVPSLCSNGGAETAGPLGVCHVSVAGAAAVVYVGSCVLCDPPAGVLRRLVAAQVHRLTRSG